MWNLHRPTKENGGCVTSEFKTFETMTPTILGRFLSKIEKTESCWLWKAFLMKQPGYEYGLFTTDGSRHHKELAHRVAYEIFIAPIPDYKTIGHSCENRSCVNPKHLFLLDKAYGGSNKSKGRKAALPANSLCSFTEHKLCRKEATQGTFECSCECHTREVVA